MEKLIVIQSSELFSFVTGVLQDAGIDFLHAPHYVEGVRGRSGEFAGELIRVSRHDYAAACALMAQAGLQVD